MSVDQHLAIFFIYQYVAMVFSIASLPVDSNGDLELAKMFLGLHRSTSTMVHIDKNCKKTCFRLSVEVTPNHVSQTSNHEREMLIKPTTFPSMLPSMLTELLCPSVFFEGRKGNVRKCLSIDLLVLFFK